MIRIILLTMCFSASAALGQDSSYASKKFDLQIFQYQRTQVEEKKIDKQTYLKHTKPFSKWDPRPLEMPQVWIMGELHAASTVPNFYWGSFADYYGYSLEEAQAVPNIFLRTAYDQEPTLTTFFKKREKAFANLTDQVVRSGKRIYLRQKGLSRIDDLFLEDDTYWRYVVPQDSPFPMSDSVATGVNDEFDAADLSILKSMVQLNIYAIHQNAEAIFFLVDGVLDNSFGYAFQKTDKPIVADHLFNISRTTTLAPKYVYYVAR